MKKLLITALFFISFFVKAQENREIYYGLFAGANYSNISNLEPMIIPKWMRYANYTAKTKNGYGALGGVFVNWKYPYAKLSMQTEIFYSQQKASLNYLDIYNLNYKINFNFNYFNAGILLKVYPFKGFYLSAGPYAGFNLTPDNIEYKSNAEEILGEKTVYYTPDPKVQKILKQYLKGKDFFYFQFGLGHEFESGITIGANYLLGITDAIETQDNPYNYSEKKNKLTNFSFRIGYIFKFDEKGNF